MRSGDWIYEIKFDGYRALALRGGSETLMLIYGLLQLSNLLAFANRHLESPATWRRLHGQQRKGTDEDNVSISRS